MFTKRMALDAVQLMDISYNEGLWSDSNELYRYILEYYPETFREHYYILSDEDFIYYCDKLGLDKKQIQDQLIVISKRKTM